MMPACGNLEEAEKEPADQDDFLSLFGLVRRALMKTPPTPPPYSLRKRLPNTFKFKYIDRSLLSKGIVRKKTVRLGKKLLLVKRQTIRNKIRNNNHSQKHGFKVSCTNASLLKINTIDFVVNIVRLDESSIERIQDDLRNGVVVDNIMIKLYKRLPPSILHFKANLEGKLKVNFDYENWENDKQRDRASLQNLISSVNNQNISYTALVYNANERQSLVLKESQINNQTNVNKGFMCQINSSIDVNIPQYSCTETRNLHNQKTNSHILLPSVQNNDTPTPETQNINMTAKNREMQNGFSFDCTNISNVANIFQNCPQGSINSQFVNQVSNMLIRGNFFGNFKHVSNEPTITSVPESEKENIIAYIDLSDSENSETLAPTVEVDKTVYIDLCESDEE